jgi:ATP-dependent Clp protease ATP-binding subunit ClpX
VSTVAPVIRPRSWSGIRGRTPSDAATGGPGEVPRSPSQILARLEREVVGQRDALGGLSLLLAMHALRPRASRAPNALVIGPTGVGKTHALAVASRFMGLPFVTTDATSLVPSGIVGEQVEDLMEALVASAAGILAASGQARLPDDEVALAQRGIVLIDEFDKLAAHDDGTSGSRAERRVIQRRLLKLAEGARVRVGVKRHADERPDRFIDSSGVLLIASGAFSELPFHRRRVVSMDIISAGFIPELVGRLPVIIAFESLSPQDFVAILDHDGVSPLALWRHYFETALMAGLHLDEGAKWVVAERATSLGMGARGLQQVLFPVLAERARALVGAAERREVTLRATDFMPQVTGLPVGAPVQ